ncbi:MAG: hypothetical protein WC267_02510 [Bacilli bacterium]
MKFNLLNQQKLVSVIVGGFLLLSISGCNKKIAFFGNEDLNKSGDTYYTYDEGETAQNHYRYPDHKNTYYIRKIGDSEVKQNRYRYPDHKNTYYIAKEKPNKQKQYKYPNHKNTY